MKTTFLIILLILDIVAGVISSVAVMASYARGDLVFSIVMVAITAMFAAVAIMIARILLADRQPQVSSKDQ